MEAPGAATTLGGGGGGSQLPFDDDGGFAAAAGLKLGGGAESGRALASAAAPVPFDGGGPLEPEDCGANEDGTGFGAEASATGAAGGSGASEASRFKSSGLGESLTNFMVARGAGPLGLIGRTGGGADAAGEERGAATASMPRGSVPRRAGIGPGLRAGGPGRDAAGSDEAGAAGATAATPPDGDGMDSGRTAAIVRVESMRTAAISVEPSVESE